MAFDLLKGVFPIGGWVGPSGLKDNSPSFLEDKYFELLRDSGINLMYGNTEHNGSSDVMKGLELCDKYGISYLVNDSRYRKEDFSEEEGLLELKKYLKYKSFVGIAVHDEPFLKDMETLRLARERHKKTFEITTFHTNLFPIYCDSAGTTMRTTHEDCSYEEYVAYIEKYIECAKPNHLSYDMYPFQWEYGKCSPIYFENLEFIRGYAEKLKIPFWCFIQVTSPNKIWRDMTEDEIRWQVLTSLAFGVKGINYFTFCTPVDPGSENFGDGMLDRKGNPTPKYYFVQNVNKRAKIWGRELLYASHKAIIPAKKNIAPLSSSIAVEKFDSLIKAVGDTALIGCFEEGNKPLYLVVNTSLFEKVDCTLVFNKKVKLQNVENGDIFENNSISFSLEKSDGILLKKI